MAMNTKLIAVASVVLVAALLTTTAAAQDVDREIQFEDNVTVGEETTVTYISNIHESPAEVEADIQITLFVDDEEIDSTTVTREITDGTQIRANFTHTFESAGERQVRVETLTQALGTEREGSVETTVTVNAAAGAETNGNETDTDEGADDEMTTDDGDDAGNETDDGGTTDNETDGEEGGDDSEGEGLPGFTAVVALVAVAVAAIHRAGS